MLRVKHYTIPIFIPELACPFQCVFCNQKKISGQTHIPTGDEITKTIDSHLRTFRRKNKNVEVGFFGGSFTGIPIDEQKQYLKYVQPYIRLEKVQSIRLSTRPDYITEEILLMLKKYNVTTIELGAQSFDDEVLKTTRRGHSSHDIVVASELILKHGFNLGLQMMVGLPGDTLEKSINTAKRIIESGAHNTRIYPSLVIKDTLMHNWYNDGKYKPLSLSEAASWCKIILPMFEQAGIDVLRVGLHPSEGLTSGDELIDGPFHSSFKELVLTEIWADILKQATENIKEEKLEIRVNPKEINYAIGYKSKNKNELLSKFRYVMFITDESIAGRGIKIH